MAKVNISGVNDSAFGLTTPANSFNIPDAPKRLERSVLGSPYYLTDSNGVEHFMPVVFKDTPFGDFLVPFSIVSVSISKNIVSTSMPLRNGTVKEVVSINDYQINIKGVCVADGDNYPEDDVEKLQELFVVNRSLTLQCAMTDIFLKGDFNQAVIIKSLKLPEVKGTQNVQPFEIECESDMFFTLEID